MKHETFNRDIYLDLGMCVRVCVRCTLYRRTVYICVYIYWKYFRKSISKMHNTPLSFDRDQSILEIGYGTILNAKWQMVWNGYGYERAKEREREQENEYVSPSVWNAASVSKWFWENTPKIFSFFPSQYSINFALFWIPTEFHFRLICLGMLFRLHLYRRHLCVCVFAHKHIFSLHWQPKHLSSNNPSINLEKKRGKSSKCNKRNRKNEKKTFTIYSMCININTYNTRTHKQIHRCKRININIFIYLFFLSTSHCLLFADAICRCTAALLVNSKMGIQNRKNMCWFFFKKKKIRNCLFLFYGIVAVFSVGHFFAAASFSLFFCYRFSRYILCLKQIE